MKTTKWLLPLLGLLCIPARPEPLTIMRATTESKGGVAVLFEARLEPEAEDSQLRGFGGGVMRRRPEVVHRWMAQTARKEYFGYDVQITPTATENEFRVSILPLSLAKSELRMKDAETWTEIAPARYPAPQTMQLGDTLALDLLVNPGTQQKVVDYLSLGDPLRRLTAAGPAHDFAASDAELHLNKPRLLVNGVEAGRNDDGAASGHVVWVDLRRHGRLGLSLLPRSLPSAPVFQKAGETRGSTLKFELGADRFEINCEGRIAPGPGAYNLYVSQQPAYPLDSGVEFSFGAEHLDETLLH